LLGSMILILFRSGGLRLGVFPPGSRLCSLVAQSLRRRGLAFLRRLGTCFQSNLKEALLTLSGSIAPAIGVRSGGGGAATSHFRAILVLRVPRRRTTSSPLVVFSSGSSLYRRSFFSTPSRFLGRNFPGVRRSCNFRSERLILGHAFIGAASPRL